MRKIRINNDFTHHWAIVLENNPINLTSLPKRLYLSHPREVKEIEKFKTTGNVISVDFTKYLLNKIGVYSLELYYEIPDLSRENGVRQCAVDTKLCQIVETTAEADEVAEFSTTSDMAFGFKGLSAYEVWHETHEGTLEDYENWLQKPATDAVSLIEDKIETLDTAIQQEEQRELAEGVRLSNEQSRVEAEGARVQAESGRLAAEIIRQSNEGDRIENESTRIQNEAERISKENVRQGSEIDRVEAEGLRVQAESERVQAEVERQITIQEAVTATNLANEKANLANTAAQNADDARDNIMPSVLNNEEVQAETYNDLNERIIALENLVKEAIYSKITTDTIDVISEIKMKGSPLIYVKDEAPSFAPDQLPQFYIDTAARKLYTARGTDSVSDWF